MSKENHQVGQAKETHPKENNVLKKPLLMNFIRKKLKAVEMPTARTTESFIAISDGSSNSETSFHPSQSFPSVSQNSSSCTQSSRSTTLYKEMVRKPEQKKRNSRKTQTFTSKTVLNVVPTVLISEIKSYTSTAEALRDAIAKLYRSEEYVLEVIKKYVFDEGFKKELLDASSVYFSLQNDTKSQALVLVNDNLLSQIEADKSHRKVLTENLDFLVKQNRSLQEEVENMYRNCERFSLKLLSGGKNQQAVGRILMKNIVTNNRTLHRKMKAMAEIIQVFETKMAEKQDYVEKVEGEKKSLEKQLEKVLETSGALITEHELDCALTKKQLKIEMKKIEEVNRNGNGLLEDLATYERQIKSMPFSLDWPDLKLEADDPLEIISKCKSCVEELVRALITTNTNATVLAKDANKLRETNARLQENLRKSTDELDNISRLSQKSIEDDHHFELLATKEKMETLSKELEQTKGALGEAKTSIEDMTHEHTSLRRQIEDLLSRISRSKSSNYACGDVACQLKSSQEKLEYLYEDYIRLATDKDRLADKCKTLEDANCYLHAQLETHHHEVVVVRKDFESVNVENDYLKKQLESDQRTITSLQNERVKYLEEKSILKTIFQHLKNEITHVQELEGALANMSKETSRLSLIAEYNKELGDKLRSEVEIRETTIQKLKEDMKQISNIHFDSETDWCAQLTEMANVKFQLGEFLQKELKQNVELDETKKRLEATTSQKQLFEQIQKHEHLALKSLLKNFKAVVKQRDMLLGNVEEITQENTNLKLKLEEQTNLCKTLKQEMTDQNQQSEKVQECDKITDDAEKSHNKHKNDLARCQKKIKHLEKHLEKLRMDKEELEKSNEYLKNNTQKLHDDLNEARRKEKDALESFTWKEVEKASLESELERCRSALGGLERGDGGATNTENNCASSNNGTDRKEIEDLKEKIRAGDGKIARLEGELQSVNRQVDFQERIMVQYENEIVRLSALEKLLKRYEVELEELRMYKIQQEKNQQEMFDNRQEKTAPSNVVFNERSVQAERPFQEQDHNGNTETVTVDNITMPLAKVIQALKDEKLHNMELAEAYEQLKWECKEKDDAYVDEVKLHRETLQKIADMQDYLKNIELERDELENKIDVISMEGDRNKEECVQLCNENVNLRNIFEQAKQKCVMMVERYMMLEAELKYQYDMKYKYDEEMEDLMAELKQSDVTVEELKKEVESGQKSLFHIKEEYYRLQQEVTCLEFKNCELTLELHETQGKLATEQRLIDELKQERKLRNSSPNESSSS